MAISVKGFDGNPFDQRSIESVVRFITCVHALVFSGNYTTGGDTLDWTNGGVNSAVPPAQSSTTGPIQCTMDDNTPLGTTVTGKNGSYILLPGTNLTNWKVKIFVTPGVEYTQGAYGTDVTGDSVLVTTKWAR